jgi:very-short-patch-repair endonuclease
MPGVGSIERGIRDRKSPPGVRIARLAERQHGVVAHRQLVELGLDRSAVGRWASAGHLIQVHVGVYAVGHGRLSRNARWMAAVLACGSGALLSHSSAAALWGIRVTAGSLIDVSATRSRHRRPGITLHRPRRLHAEDRATRNGIPVTSIARTLLDLAAVVRPRQLARAIDEADRLGVLDVRATERSISRTNGHRGRGLLRRALLVNRGPQAVTRSELERRFLSLCREAGLPRPQVNIAIEGVEVDVAWPARRLVVELDGYEFHRTRARFEEDRSRDGELLVAGYRVLRITHRRLESDAPGVVAAVRRLLADGGR